MELQVTSLGKRCYWCCKCINYIWFLKDISQKICESGLKGTKMVFIKLNYLYWAYWFVEQIVEQIQQIVCINHWYSAHSVTSNISYQEISLRIQRKTLNMTMINELMQDCKDWISDLTEVMRNEREMQVRLAMYLKEKGHYDNVHVE